MQITVNFHRIMKCHVWKTFPVTVTKYLSRSDLRNSSSKKRTSSQRSAIRKKEWRNKFKRKFKERKRLFTCQKKRWDIIPHMKTSIRINNITQECRWCQILICLLSRSNNLINTPCRSIPSTFYLITWLLFRNHTNWTLQLLPPLIQQWYILRSNSRRWNNSLLLSTKIFAVASEATQISLCNIISTSPSMIVVIPRISRRMIIMGP